MTDLQKLLALAPAADATEAPGRIEFGAYVNGKLIPACGKDHMMWTLPIGADHTATIYMHKDDHAALLDLADAGGIQIDG